MPGHTDPFRAQTFYIEFGKHFSGPVLKVVGLAYEREVKTVQQTIKDGKVMINQLGGKYMPAILTIHKAVTKDKGFWDWRQQVLDVSDMSKVRVPGSITVYDYANGKATLKWNIIGAWPSRIKGPIINIEAEAAIEEIDICYEQLEQAL